MGGAFQYLNPGTIHWGEGSVAALDAELSRAGVKRVFLITTGSIARNPPVLAPVGGVVGARVVGRTAAIGPRAPVREVARAAHEVREAKADALLSVGGGSPIDAAKAVAWSLAAGVDLADADPPATA